METVHHVKAHGCFKAQITLTYQGLAELLRTTLESRSQESGSKKVGFLMETLMGSDEECRKSNTEKEKN